MVGTSGTAGSIPATSMKSVFDLTWNGYSDVSFPGKDAWAIPGKCPIVVQHDMYQQILYREVSRRPPD